MKRFLVCFFILPLFLNLPTAADEPFKTIERFKVEVDQPFSSFTSFRNVSDGFVLYLQESRTSQNKGFLVKVDKGGRFLTKYKDWGNGPGQLREIDNIHIIEDHVFACESVSPWIHTFDRNLKFLNDIKIKKGGKIVVHNDKYIGIWSLNIKGENDAYKLAIYDRKNFKFNRYAYPVKEIPLLVQHWGGICKVNENTYAGVYPPDFQIKLFDGEFNFVKDLLTKTPAHIVRHTKWKKDPNTLNNEMLEWYYGWSKIHSVFFSKNHYIVKYQYKKKGYIDVFDSEGKLKFKQIQYPEKTISFVDGDDIWFIEWVETEDDRDYYLVKTELNL